MIQLTKEQQKHRKKVAARIAKIISDNPFRARYSITELILADPDIAILDRSKKKPSVVITCPILPKGD